MAIRPKFQIGQLVALRETLDKDVKPELGIVEEINICREFDAHEHNGILITYRINRDLWYSEDALTLIEISLKKEKV